MYRISWRSRRTGTTGNGEPIFPTYKEANEIAQEADDQHKRYPGDKLPDGPLCHWVEFIETDGEKKQKEK